MTPAEKAFATNLLNKELTQRRTRHDMLVNKFGDRITIAIQAEVDHLAKEIEALEKCLELVANADEG